VKAADAKRAAEKQYEKFALNRKLASQKEAERLISSLASEVKKLPKTPRR